MARQSKDYRYLNCKLDRILFEQLEEQSVKSRMTKTAIIETALEKYFKEEMKIGKGSENGIKGFS